MTETTCLDTLLAGCKMCFSDYDCQTCDVFHQYQQLKHPDPTSEQKTNQENLKV